MNKKQLLEMPKLKVTPSMYRMAMADKPKITVHSNWYGNKYETREHNTAVYLRCCVKNGILKLSCFITEDIRTSVKKPLYEIYFSKEEKTYLTYNTENGHWLTGSFWRLKWPSYFYSIKISCCQETQKAIQGYFEDESTDAITLISRFQGKIMDERLVKRHKKQTDPWDEDMKQTPPLPKDWKRWVNKVGIPENYIFYRYSRNKVRDGYCTYCENTVKVSLPHHNAEGICPHCHRKIVFKSVGRFKRLFTDRYIMCLMQKCKDGYMIRKFEGYRRYTFDNYKNPEVSVFEYRRTIGNAKDRVIRSYFYGSYKNVEYRWIRSEDAPAYYLRNNTGKVYGKTLPSLFKGELKTTGLKEYMQYKPDINPEKYLVAFTSCPFLEKTVKVGLTKLSDEMIESYTWNRKQFLPVTTENIQESIIKILMLTPTAFRKLKKYNGNMDMLTWLQHETDTKKEIPEETLLWLLANSITPKTFDFISDRMNVLQIESYVKRQMTDNSMKLREVIDTWQDYLSMAERFGYDINDEIVYRVRKLKQRHDELVDLCNQEDDETRAKEIRAKFSNLETNLLDVKDKYEYANDDYTVIVPTKIEQILSEGRALHHCVANIDKYWDRIDRNEAYVFFLRKSERPNQAYYTLEVEPCGTVRQKRTMYDRQEKDISDASDFLREWQKVIKERMTDKDRELAKTSRILRFENFKELSKKNIIINTGQLQDQRLVDVLMADLMEAA